MEVSEGAVLGFFCARLTALVRRFGERFGTLTTVLEDAIVALFRLHGGFSRIFRFSVLASRAGGQNRPKTAVWARFRLFSAPKTEGPGSPLGSRPKTARKPVLARGIAHLGHFEHCWGGQARRFSFPCALFRFPCGFSGSGGRFWAFWGGP